MAQSWSAAFKWAVPLPMEVGRDSGTRPASLVCFSTTGPATSVGAGMAISGLSTNLTTISAAWFTEDTSHGYKFGYAGGASQTVGSSLVHVSRMSTGAQLSDAVDLSSVTLYLMAIGTGPLASAVD